MQTTSSKRKSVPFREYAAYHANRLWEGKTYYPGDWILLWSLFCAWLTLVACLLGMWWLSLYPGFCSLFSFIVWIVFDNWIDPTVRTN
jgi:hypothetical protein